MEIKMVVYTYEAPRHEDTSIGRKLILERKASDGSSARYEECPAGELVAKLLLTREKTKQRAVGVINAPDIFRGTEEDRAKFEKLVQATHKPDIKISPGTYLPMLSNQLMFDGSYVKPYDSKEIQQGNPVVIIREGRDKRDIKKEGYITNVVCGVYTGAGVGAIGAIIWACSNNAPMNIEPVVGGGLVGGIIGFIINKYLSKSTQADNLSTDFQDYYSQLSLLETEAIQDYALEEYQSAKEKLDGTFDELVKSVEEPYTTQGASVILKGENLFPKLEEIARRFSPQSLLNPEGVLTN